MLYKIKAKRVELGIKQKDFAKQLGITSQYLSYIEKGVASPSLFLAKKIADSLNSNIYDLFFYEEIEKIQE